MMVKDVTQMPSGGSGYALNMCLQGFIQDLRVLVGGTPKFGVDVVGVYST